MMVAVASKSPIKIAAVKQALEKMRLRAEVVSHDAHSRVRMQPIGKEEIEKGVFNRIEALLPVTREAYLVAIENGLIKKDDGFWYDVAAVAVCLPRGEGKPHVVMSDGVMVSEPMVKEVFFRGPDTCTIGDIVVEWLQGDKHDPHWKLTQGRLDTPPRHRQDILAEAVVTVFREICPF